MHQLELHVDAVVNVEVRLMVDFAEDLRHEERERLNVEGEAIDDEGNAELGKGGKGDVEECYVDNEL